jgi:SAM-dependent methyltransferase
MTFSRTKPSPRYTSLVAMYRYMHERGSAEHGLSAVATFAGTSLMRHIQRIKELIGRTGASTILDYGCGKGALYLPHPLAIKGVGTFDGVVDYWGVDNVACYDPAYEPFSALPKEQFDGVVCTDVMEHCPEEDLGWIVAEIFSFARRFVYVNVACFPAEKLLPNGENAHCTIQPPEWWAGLFREAARRYPGIVWELWTLGLPVRGKEMRETRTTG